MDAGVVLGDDADVVLDDAFAEVLPALMGFGVIGGFSGREDVGGGEVGSEIRLNRRPTHEFRDSEEFQ